MVKVEGLRRSEFIMASLDKLVNAITDDKDKEVQRDLGYLTRAVEDLTHKLETHMDKEERDRTRAVQDFSEYRSKTDSRLRGLEEGVAEAKKETKALKPYIYVTIAIGLLGLVIEDTELLKSAWLIVIKGVFGGG